jgi:hypothetical protein
MNGKKEVSLGGRIGFAVVHEGAETMSCLKHLKMVNNNIFHILNALRYRGMLNLVDSV